MEDVRTTLFDVQAALLTRFSDKTILVGHSLESDFQALKVRKILVTALASSTLLIPLHMSENGKVRSS